MPRKPAAKKAAASRPSTTSSPGVEDPLADLREDDGARYPEEGQEGAQEGLGAPEGDSPLATLVGEAMGAVSVCWEPAPEGVFMSEAASAIVDDLLEAIQPMLEVQALDADEAVARWHKDTVAVGFLHKGGRCGCAYLARVILGA
jgi:hypothetical protein